MRKEELTGEHLILRKARREDTDTIWKNVWSQKELAETMLWTVTETYEEAEKRMERTMRFQALFDGYFVCLKETDEPIGFATVKAMGEGVYEESGICIARRYQNQGYGTELLGLLLDYVFIDLQGRRFIYSCFRENKRSAAVAKKYGFRYLDTKSMVRDHDQKVFDVDEYDLDAETWFLSQKQKK